VTSSERFKRWYKKNRAKKNAYDRAWRKRNPEKFKAGVMRQQVKARYGVTLEEWKALRKKPCEICGSRKDICLDHCHVSKKIRGALCRRCNSALGLLKDDPARLKKAIKYLERKAA
jgi:hypothetical protein